MRNLLIFISKYSAFFLFLIFEVISLVIFIKYNSFQKASFINTSNQVTGTLYSRVSELNSYVSLKEVNDSLVKENARLRGQLKSAYFVDSVSSHTVTDTIYKQQYTYIDARVINNTINHRNNYLTINRGSKDGVAKGMGVICSSGVVGLVVNTTEHLANVQSFLHKDTKFSAMLADTKDIGSMIWTDDLNSRKGILIDVPNHVKPRLGQLVVTSGYSLFPTGIPYGKITNLHAKSGGFFLNMEVALSVDFSKLQYVYVVKNKFATEQTGVEALQKKDE
jgi:rod shape-determining protein MreC